eukprot:TRINITY_DN549_c0_g2_i6.p1 TRINITY_DN549_c0_g2~~TRINITY_DN549_c0_g2_i6.p1  ORF type:complete len:952 (+),score=208.32 TRINITY_DN549_c0_g2_i6:425-2857(+)
MELCLHDLKGGTEIALPHCLSCPTLSADVVRERLESVRTETQLLEAYRALGPGAAEDVVQMLDSVCPRSDQQNYAKLKLLAEAHHQLGKMSDALRCIGQMLQLQGKKEEQQYAADKAKQILWSCDISKIAESTMEALKAGVIPLLYATPPNVSAWVVLYLLRKAQGFPSREQFIEFLSHTHTMMAKLMPCDANEGEFLHCVVDELVAPLLNAAPATPGAAAADPDCEFAALVGAPRDAWCHTFQQCLSCLYRFPYLVTSSHRSGGGVPLAGNRERICKALVYFHQNWHTLILQERVGEFVEQLAEAFPRPLTRYGPARDEVLGFLGEEPQLLDGAQVPELQNLFTTVHEDEDAYWKGSDQDGSQNFAYVYRVVYRMRYEYLHETRGKSPEGQITLSPREQQQLRDEQRLLLYDLFVTPERGESWFNLGQQYQSILTAVLDVIGYRPQFDADLVQRVVGDFTQLACKCFRRAGECGYNVGLVSQEIAVCFYILSMYLNKKSIDYSKKRSSVLLEASAAVEKCQNAAPLNWFHHYLFWRISEKLGYYPDPTERAQASERALDYYNKGRSQSYEIEYRFQALRLKLYLTNAIPVAKLVEKYNVGKRRSGESPQMQLYNQIYALRKLKNNLSFHHKAGFLLARLHECNIKRNLDESKKELEKLVMKSGITCGPIKAMAMGNPVQISSAAMRHIFGLRGGRERFYRHKYTALFIQVLREQRTVNTLLYLTSGTDDPSNVKAAEEALVVVVRDLLHNVLKDPAKKDKQAVEDLLRVLFELVLADDTQSTSTPSPRDVVFMEAYQCARIYTCIHLHL